MCVWGVFFISSLFIIQVANKHVVNKTLVNGLNVYFRLLRVMRFFFFSIKIKFLKWEINKNVMLWVTKNTDISYFLKKIHMAICGISLRFRRNSLI